MSNTTNNVNDIDLQVISPLPMQRKINLYVLRNTTADDKFKIKAYFNNDIKCTFNRIETFDEKVPISPYIYRAELDLIIDKHDRLFVILQNGSVPIQNYRLRLSRKIPQTDTTFRDYSDDKDRCIENPRSTVHYFIFDVNFARNLVDGPPGKNLFKRKTLNILKINLFYRTQCTFLESVMFIYFLYSSLSNV